MEKINKISKVSQEDIIKELLENLEINIAHYMETGLAYFEGKLWAYRYALLIAGVWNVSGIVEEIKSKIFYQNLLQEESNQAMAAVF